MTSVAMRFAVAALVLAACVGATAQSNEHRATQGPLPPSHFSTSPRGTFDERDGESLYRSICQGCHMPDGRGASGAGTYPALASNPRAASAEYLALTILGGRRNMPSFAAALDDAQVAEVVTYVRTHFGNAYASPFTAAQAAALRTSR